MQIPAETVVLISMSSWQISRRRLSRGGSGFGANNECASAPCRSDASEIYNGMNRAANCGRFIGLPSLFSRRTIQPCAANDCSTLALVAEDVAACGGWALVAWGSWNWSDLRKVMHDLPVEQWNGGIYKIRALPRYTAALRGRNGKSFRDA